MNVCNKKIFKIYLKSFYEVLVCDHELVLTSITKWQYRVSLFNHVPYNSNFNALLQDYIQYLILILKLILASFCDATNDCRCHSVVESLPDDNLIEIHVSNLGCSISDNEFS